jgi:acetyl esterase/lipase
MCDFSQYGGPNQELLDVLATLPPSPELSLSELKRTTNAGRETVAAQQMQTLAPKVSIQDHTIPARDGSSLEARTYRDKAIPEEAALPIYMHFHGGGFLFGTLASEDATCARIALEAGVVVLNVNYRHTPEWKYPTAWHDSEDAFHWAVANGPVAFHGDADQIVLGGISAGGQLAAALALTLKREHEAGALARVKGQVLMIPCLVHAARYGPLLRQMRDPAVSSYKENESAPLLPKARVDLFLGLLCPEPPPEEDRRANVALATGEEVRGLPPAVFGVAGLDPLRDEALLYAKLLAENG